MVHYRTAPSGRRGFRLSPTWLKFCAGFGSRGIFNFGSLGESTEVADDEGARSTGRRSRQISAWALGIGVTVGVVAVLLPV